MYTDNSEYLCHYGKLGMKWGQRSIARAQAGLNRLESGKHLSVGFNKNRQSEYDERDKRILENRITRIKRSLDNNEKQDMAKFKKAGTKAASTATAALNFRKQHTFDTSDLGPDITKVYIDNPKLVAKAERADAHVNRLMSQLNKKYNGTVSAAFKQDSDTGKQYVDLMLGSQKDRVDIG